MKINVNTANIKELCELKGVGPALAKRIVTYRENQPFKKAKDLENVQGISEETLKEWKGQLSYRMTKKKVTKKPTQKSKSKATTKSKTRTSTKSKPKTTNKKKTTTKRTVKAKTKRKKSDEYEGEPTLKEVVTGFIDSALTNFIRDKFEDFDDFLEKRTAPKKKDIPPIIRQKKGFIHRDHTKRKPKSKPKKIIETNAKTLTFSQINNFANDLKIDPAAMRAVIEVESSGGGFLPDGRPKILFEGHIFWSLIEAKGLKPRKLCKGNEDILYSRWTKKHYKGGAAEHDRLERAKAIHEQAALSSASWGMFQVMGFNYYVTDYRNVTDFVEAQYASELEHLKAFIGFVTSNKLLDHLRTRDWAKFACGYNGKSYKKNKYDERLEAAYQKFKYQP